MRGALLLGAASLLSGCPRLYDANLPSMPRRATCSLTNGGTGPCAPEARAYGYVAVDPGSAVNRTVAREICDVHSDLRRADQRSVRAVIVWTVDAIPRETCADLVAKSDASWVPQALGECPEASAGHRVYRIFRQRQQREPLLLIMSRHPPRMIRRAVAGDLEPRLMAGFCRDWMARDVGAYTPETAARLYQSFESYAAGAAPIDDWEPDPVDQAGGVFAEWTGALWRFYRSLAD